MQKLGDVLKNQMRLVTCVECKDEFEVLKNVEEYQCPTCGCHHPVEITSLEAVRVHSETENA